MTDLLDVLTPPAERGLPPGRLGLRRAALLQMVEADLRRGARRSPRLAVLRSVRAWLLIAAFVLLFALGAAIGSARASGAPTRPQVVVAGIAAVAAPVVVSLAVDGWRRSLDFPRTRHDTQPAGVALGAA